MDSKMNWQPYIELVDFIGECFGKNVEVVLHDLTNMEHSVIAIKHGYITGRSVGAPLTMFALNKIKEQESSNTSSIMNYKGTAKNGNILRSSSFFIKNDAGKVVGMLCVNIDVADLKKAAELLNLLSFVGNAPADYAVEESDLRESFPASVQDMVKDTLSEIISSESIQIERLRADEKISIVEQLQSKGLFQVKGAVSEVAAQLMVSEPTVYRYLNIINRKNKRNIV